MKKNQKLIRLDLHKELIQFYKSCLRFKSKNKIPDELEGIIEKHFTKASKIVADYRLNDYKMDRSKGRPKNLEGRQYFYEKISSFQNENLTLGFPKKEDFLDELQQENFKRRQNGFSSIRLGDRTFDKYINEWKDGFFNLNL
jgi:hypothetical protein